MKLICQTDERTRTLLPLYLRTAGSHLTQRPVNRPKGGDFHQFLYIEQGDGLFETPGGNLRLSEGSAVFTRRGTPVAYRQDSDCFRTAWITMDGPFSDSLLEYLHAPPFAHIGGKAVYPLMERLCKLAARNEAPERLSAAVYDLTVTFFETLRAETQTPALLCAKSYMEQHLSRDLSVEEIARAAGISESLLFRLFRTEAHTTPVAYLQQLRIHRAMQLLTDLSAIPIFEIAAQCGFWDVSYFCRVFRKQTGMTPRVYRSKRMAE